MEITFKQTTAGEYTAEFEHDDVLFQIDWEDDSNTVYIFQQFGMDNRKLIALPVETLEPIIRILTQIKNNQGQ